MQQQSRNGRESRSPPLCPAPPTPCPLPPSCASRDQRFRKIRKWKREDRSKRKLFFFRWPDKKNKAKKKLEQVRFFFLPVTSFSIPPPCFFSLLLLFLKIEFYVQLAGPLSRSPSHPPTHSTTPLLHLSKQKKPTNQQSTQKKQSWFLPPSFFVWSRIFFCRLVRSIRSRRIVRRRRTHPPLPAPSPRPHSFPIPLLFISKHQLQQQQHNKKKQKEMYLHRYI